MTERANTQSPVPPRDSRQPADFDPIALGRTLLRSARVGSLGTIDRVSGHPSVSLVALATDLDGSPILLVSGLSHHTKNLGSDARASLLISMGGKGDPLAHPRLALMGSVVPALSETCRRRYLARQPKAKLYVDFPDFRFLRFVPERIALNGGFARAYDGPAEHLMNPEAMSRDFAELERSAIAHLNQDHPESLALYAEKLCGMKAGKAKTSGYLKTSGWRATGLDPHGLDLARGELIARLGFETPVYDARSLRQILKTLADKARSGLLA